MADLKSYLASRQQKSQQLVEATQEKSYSEDTRFWKPTLDKEKGVGGAVIRFLPVTDGSTLDFVEYRHYAFEWQDTKQWFIEKSFFPLVQAEDPVYQLRQRLYATNQEVDKKLAEKMPLSRAFVANILVIRDPSNPQNEGKFFLYRYNATISNLIATSANPKPDPLTGEKPEPMFAFDLVEGANLEIRISKSDRGWDYTGTKFAKPSSIIETEEDFSKITENTRSLAEFIDPKSLKSYEVLAQRLKKVIGKDYIGSGVAVVEGSAPLPTSTASAPAQSKPASQAPKAEAPAIPEDNSPPFEPDAPSSEPDSDDEFARLMAGMS